MQPSNFIDYFSQDALMLILFPFLPNYTISKDLHHFWKVLYCLKFLLWTQHRRIEIFPFYENF